MQLINNTHEQSFWGKLLNETIQKTKGYGYKTREENIFRIELHSLYFNRKYYFYFFNTHLNVSCNKQNNLLSQKKKTKINSINMLRDLLLKPYYIANFLLVLAYPITRVMKLFRFDRLDTVDELGLTKENSLFYTIIAFTILKWMKRYSTTQFLGDLFFTIKIALISGYIFVDANVALIYFSACLIIWLLFKQPEYTGESRIKKINTINEFEDLLDIDIKDDCDIVEEIQTKYESKTKLKKKKHQKPQSYYKELAQIVFCEFYVDWAETCNYTKEIWAEFSMKYTTKKFVFVSVNLSKLPKLAELYQINTSSISRQLPTVILFENGEEIQRFPPIDKKTLRIAKVLRYDKKEISKYFDLDRRYLTIREE